MGKVLFNISVSLDGFVESPVDGVARLFRWYFSGDTEVPFSDDLTFKVSAASATLFRTVWPTVGADITGRRNFDVANAWQGKPPLGVPCVVVTNRVPQEWVYEGSPFTFVTDGIESAVAQAKRLAGDKHVAVSTPSIMQQCLKAGLLDELTLDLVPVLLGAGTRLFANLEDTPVDLEPLGVVEGTGVTHLRYRVIK